MAGGVWPHHVSVFDVRLVVFRSSALLDSHKVVGRRREFRRVLFGEAALRSMKAGYRGKVRWICLMPAPIRYGEDTMTP